MWKNGNDQSARQEREFIQAVRRDDSPAVNALLDNRPQLADAKVIGGGTAATTAAIFGCKQVLECLLRRNPRLFAERTDTGYTLLHTAAESGHHDIVAFLLEKKPDLLKERSSFGDTALHAAAEGGHVDIAKLLVSQKPELISAEDASGRTALDIASERMDQVIASSEKGRPDETLRFLQQASGASAARAEPTTWKERAQKADQSKKKEGRV